MRRISIEQSGLHKKRSTQLTAKPRRDQWLPLCHYHSGFSVRHAEERAATARGALTNRGLHGKCRQIPHNRLAKICPLPSYHYAKEHLTPLPTGRSFSHKLRQTAHLGKRTQNSNQTHTEGSSPPCLGSCLSIFMSCPEDSARSGNVLTSDSVSRVKIPPCSSRL